LALCHGFALSKAQAWPIMQEFNARCKPPWNERELEHKLDHAAKVTRHPQHRGYLLGERGHVPPSPAQPGPAVARALDIEMSEPLPGASQPTTLTTLKSDLIACVRTHAHTRAHAYARKSENNVVNVVECTPNTLVSSKSGTKAAEEMKTQPTGGAPRLASDQPEVSPQLSRDDEAEASRIARELVKLHRDRAMATKGDASFYANLIRDFGAIYTGPPDAAAAFHPPNWSRNRPVAFDRAREWISIPRTWRTRSASREKVAFPSSSPLAARAAIFGDAPDAC
jgi:hypothetical protein